MKAEKSNNGLAKPDYGDVPFESFVFNGKGQSPDRLLGELKTFVVEKAKLSGSASSTVRRRMP